MTRREAVAWARDLMRRRRPADADRLALDAERILCHLLGTGRSLLYTEGHLPLDPPTERHYREMVLRRARGEPLQYILGDETFGPFRLRVDPRVLIPRPETYMLVEKTIRLLAGRRRPCVVDLGTGSGNIAMCLADAGCRVVATDISPEALAVAEANWDAVGLGGLITPAVGDLYEALRAVGAVRSFDAVVCNPPYVRTDQLDSIQLEVRFEPRVALDGGEDGLSVIRPLVAGAGEWLRSGGYLVFEIGAGQAEAVRRLVDGEGSLRLLSIDEDEAGVPRVVSAVKT